MPNRFLTWARVVISALLLPCVISGQAQDTEPSCAQQASTPALAACLRKLLDGEQAMLAAETGNLRAKWRDLDSRDPMFKLVPALDASQLAWEAYRRDECEARALSFGAGTGAAPEYLRCMIEMTGQRRDMLARHWLH
jgi:uncharacterized protein YecT (DUF1311 family)